MAEDIESRMMQELAFIKAQVMALEMQGEDQSSETFDEPRVVEDLLEGSGGSGGGGSGLNLTNVPFGYTLSGKVFTVLAGDLNFGARDPIEVAEQVIDFGGYESGLFHVYFEYTQGGGEQIIAAGNPKPKSDDTHYRKRLYEITNSGATSVLVRVLSFGNIEIPGAYG